MYSFVVNNIIQDKNPYVYSTNEREKIKINYNDNKIYD